MVADRPAAEREALRSFGHNLGMAFQLVDDVLDYSAHQATLGKTVGDDFREGKITLPIVYAVRAADEDGKAFWRRTLEDQIQKKGDLKRAIDLLESTGALRATLERARGYSAKAGEALAGFPKSEASQALAEGIEFAVERAY